MNVRTHFIQTAILSTGKFQPIRSVSKTVLSFIALVHTVLLGVPKIQLSSARLV